MAIKWTYATRKDGTRESCGMVSDCERFRIGKYVIPVGTAYRLWYGSDCAGQYGSASEAQKAASELKKGLQ